MKKSQVAGVCRSGIKEGPAAEERWAMCCAACWFRHRSSIVACRSRWVTSEHGIALIDEYSLASRLSYFLWSAPPDDRLLQLAAKGELRKNLAAEVKRMIGDWRGWSLTEDFAGQWLQLRDMDRGRGHNERLFQIGRAASRMR
jgi:hypothetical protein